MENLVLATVLEPGPQNPRASIYRRMALVLGEVNRIPKNGENKYFNYKYATEGDLLDVLRPAMARHNLAFYVALAKIEKLDMGGSKSGDITRVHILATFADGETGCEIVVPWVGDGQDNADKGLAKALTAAVKTLLMKTFLVSSGDDPDAGPAKEEEKPAAKVAAKAASRPVQQPTPAQPAQPAVQQQQAAQPAAQPPADGQQKLTRAELFDRWDRRWQEAFSLQVPEIDPDEAIARDVEYIEPINPDTPNKELVARLKLLVAAIERRKLDEAAAEAISEAQDIAF